MTVLLLYFCAWLTYFANRQDYQEHQNEIHAKLIAIMGDRLSAHIKTLQVRSVDFPIE